MSTLGSRLKACRKESGLKQDAVCARVGISQPTLSELENDKYPTSSFVPHFATLYGVEAMWLAEGRGQKKRAPSKNGPLSEQGQMDAFLLHKISAIEALLHIVVKNDESMFNKAETMFSLYCEATLASGMDSPTYSEGETEVLKHALESTKSAVFWKNQES